MHKLEELIDFDKMNINYYNRAFLIGIYNTLIEFSFIKSFNFMFVKQYHNPSYKYELVVHMDIILDISLYTMYVLENGQNLEDKILSSCTSKKVVLNLIDVN